jgi:hypothetical protein
MNGSVMKAENPFLCRSFPCLDFVAVGTDGLPGIRLDVSALFA